MIRILYATVTESPGWFITGRSSGLGRSIAHTVYSLCRFCTGIITLRVVIVILIKEHYLTGTRAKVQGGCGSTHYI